MHKSTKSLWLLILLGLSFFGTFFLVFFSLPYETAKRLGDAAFNDGEFESLTTAVFNSIHLPLQIAGIILVLVAVTMILFRSRSLTWIETAAAAIARTWKTFQSDLGLLLKGFFSSFDNRLDNLFLVVITLIGAAIRWVYLFRATWHDEAYTYIVFAEQPLRYLIADYHLPNNHIFHTILVHFSTRLFGNELWAIRLPVFITGILLIPVGYALARTYYNRMVGLATAALIVASPVMINYSTNARGYMIMTMITLLIVGLAAYLVKHSNLAGWIFLVVLTALGFYTIPVFIYPFGMVWFWIGFNALIQIFTQQRQEGIRLLTRLAIAAVAAVLLTGFLYLPVIVQSGLSSITSNGTVAGLPWSDYLQTVNDRLKDAWNDWTNGIPLLPVYLILAGIIFSAIFHKRVSRFGISPIIAAIVWIALELAIQRPNPWAKIWTFLVPLLLMWAVAGWAALLTVIRPKAQQALTILTAVIVIGALAWSSQRAIQYYPYRMEPSHAQAATLLLKDRLQDGDIIVVSSPNDAPMEYYLELYEVPEEYYQHIETRAFSRAYVVVNFDFEQTIESVIEQRGPDLSNFDLNTAAIVQQWNYVALYEVYPDQAALEKSGGSG